MIATPWLDLVEIVMTGSLIAGAAYLITLLMWRAKASQRSMVRYLALVSLLVLPLLDMVLPGKSLDRWLATSPSAASAEPVATNTALPIETGTLIRESEARTNELSTSSSRAPVTWYQALVLVWLAGLLFCLWRLCGGQYTAWRMIRATRPCMDPGSRALLQTRAEDLGIRRRVRLAISDEIGAPLSWGFRTVTVVVPEDMASWSTSRLEPVFTHELAHVKRGDIVGQLMMRFVCAVWWFNPFAHLLARAQEEDRELACDDIVLGTGTPASQYAEILLSVAERLNRRAGLSAAVCMAGNNRLRERLVFVLDGGRQRGAAGLTGLIVTAVTTMCFGLTIVPDMRSVEHEIRDRQAEESERDGRSPFSSIANMFIGHEWDKGPETIEAIASSDAGVTALIPYIDLMPEVSVEDLLLAQQNRIGARTLARAQKAGLLERWSISELIVMRDSGIELDSLEVRRYATGKNTIIGRKGNTVIEFLPFENAEDGVRDERDDQSSEPLRGSLGSRFPVAKDDGESARAYLERARHMGLDHNYGERDLMFMKTADVDLLELEAMAGVGSHHLFTAGDLSELIRNGIPASFIGALDAENLIPPLTAKQVIDLYRGSVPIDYLVSLDRRGVLVESGPELVDLYRRGVTADEIVEAKAVANQRSEDR